MRVSDDFMNYETFKEEVLKEVKLLVGDTKEVKLNKIVKNNDLILDGLIILNKTSGISPAIYLNQFYDDYLEVCDEYSDGKLIRAIANKIMDIYNNTKPPKYAKDVSQFVDYDFVKEHLVFKVVNYDLNKKFLEDVPHFKKLDLAIIFACLLETDGECTSVIIKNEHLEKWGIDKNTLYEDAFKNISEMLPAKIFSLFKASFEKSFINSELDLNNIQLANNDLLILSNKNKINGAATILYPNVLETIANQLDSDLIIIPSSVHEVLVMRKIEDISLDDLNELVKIVNHSELEASEVLSNHVYTYSKDDRALTML